MLAVLCAPLLGICMSMEPKEKPLRSPRPKTSYFDAQHLVKEWKPFANLKNPGFDWSGFDYTKTSRSCSSSDRQGIYLYKQPLKNC